MEITEQQTPLEDELSLEELDSQIDESFESSTNYDLFKKYFENKNIKIRNELMIRNQPLVTFIVNKYYTSNKITRDVREELLQEGAIGLLSAIDGYDYRKGFKFSTYSCVPLTTQILTQNGWKYYNELNIGDKTIGYNNGVAEWTEIKKTIKHDRAEIYNFGNGNWSAKSTLDHKWLVSENGKVSLKPLSDWPNQKEFELPTIINGRHGRRDVQLITSVPFVGGNCSLTPSEASILAWVLSDTSLNEWKNNSEKEPVIVCNKKFSFAVEELLKLENAHISTTKKHVWFTHVVDQEVFNRIWEKAGLTNRTVSQLVLDMTPETRRAWLRTWHWANKRSKESFTIEGEGEILDALQLSVFLEGLPLARANKFVTNSKNYNVNWKSYNPTPRNCTIKGDPEIGSVWCPTTDLGSWTARTEDGFVFLTGNCWWIRQAVNNYLINVNPIIRVPSHIRSIQNKLMKKFNEENKNMSDEINDLSNSEQKDLHISDKMLISVKSALKSKQVTSINKPLYNNGELTTLEDIIPSDKNLYDVDLDKQKIVNTVKEALKSMPEKRRLILLLRYDVLNKNLKIKGKE